MLPTGKKPKRYDVLPHQGDNGQHWDLHQHGARRHTYFRTQREAMAAARTLGPAHVVLHARDGHVYREYDLPAPRT